jgi:hypothetical protein
MKGGDESIENSHFLSRTTQLDFFIRGSTLNIATIIEHSIGKIISYHFHMDVDKRNLFFSLIMNDRSMSFSRKIIILNDLLKICYPDIYSKNRQVRKDLQKIVDWRNLISHSNSLMTEEIKQERDFKKVHYSQYSKDQRKVISVSAEEYQERISFMNDTIHRLTKIEKEIMEINGIVDDDPTGKIDSSPLVFVFQ